MFCEWKNKDNSLSMLQFLFFCLTFALAKDENALNLIIDIGNTMAKVALFNGGEMVEVLPRPRERKRTNGWEKLRHEC